MIPCNLTPRGQGALEQQNPDPTHESIHCSNDCRYFLRAYTFMNSFLTRGRPGRPLII